MSSARVHAERALASRRRSMECGEWSHDAAGRRLTVQRLYLGGVADAPSDVLPSAGSPLRSPPRRSSSWDAGSSGAGGASSMDARDDGGAIAEDQLWYGSDAYTSNSQTGSGCIDGTYTSDSQRGSGCIDLHVESGGFDVDPIDHAAEIGQAPACGCTGSWFEPLCGGGPERTMPAAPASELASSRSHFPSWLTF